MTFLTLEHTMALLPVNISLYELFLYIYNFYECAYKQNVHYIYELFKFE